LGKILGLDIGIASVGWSIIDSNTNKIVNMGTRLFESADANNNKIRRETRAARRNLRRKNYRLKCVEELLSDYDFTSSGDINLNPYELRVKGLKEQLNPSEVYVALYHLAKRRGISYLDEAKDEGKNINDSLKINRELLKEKYPCEIQLERLNNYGKVRGIIEIENEDGSIETLINVFTTGAYEREALQILNEQRKYYEQIDNNFIEKYIDILTRKRDFYVGPGDENNRTNYGIYKTDGRIIDSIFEELIGKCSIYKDEQRAPSASFTAQEFNLLNDLNNLTINGRKLNEMEKKKIIEKMLSSNGVGVATMVKIIKEVTGIDGAIEIKGYSVDKDEKMVFNHTFEVERKLKGFLSGTSINYEDFDIDDKDRLALVLSKSMDYKSLLKNCKKDFPGFNDEDIALLFSFLQKNKSLYSKWHSFSLKVMREMREELYKNSKNQMNILIEKGIKKSIKDNFSKYKYIPVGFLNDEIYNPVVKRSINQSIEIVNAIIKKYGDLEAIVIEMPRETNEEDERKKLQKIQGDNEKEKKEATNRARNEYSITEEQLYSQKGLLTKIRLWYQQDGRCIYTGETISIQDLINYPNKFEIDHIIPKSISLDDSLNNKVLCYHNANQIKGQRTPFNAFSINSKNISYNEIKERAYKLFKVKKINKTKYDLLTFEEDINKYEVRQKFISRNLNDTRYASRVILNGLEEYMKDKGKDTYIHVVRGKFTHQIRKKWGLEKDRDESFAHHAVDATIVATCYLLGQSEGTVRNPFLQKLGRYDKSLWGIISDDKYDKEVYKLPWENFIIDLNNKVGKIKYSHKVDTKINRAISDATLYSTREVEGEDYIVEKFKNIYDNVTAKKLVEKIKDDLAKYDDPEDSKILMRKHDPKTFEILVKIIDEYSGEKLNPFEAYKKDHGNIRKYSKTENGAIIKDIKYLSTKLGQSIEISKTDKLSNDRKVVLLSLKPFRTDVYYNEKTGKYKNLGIKYNDLIFRNGKYVVRTEDYSNMKQKLEIDDSYKFLFSLHKNDIIGITYKSNPDDEERYRFLSSRSDNPNRIEIKPIEKSKFDKQNQPTIGTKVLKFNKYHADILGNIFNVTNEKLKFEFTVDNINDM